MPSVVFCDNNDCRLHDDCYGECDAAKLVVRRGVCAGSTVTGRNVSENDLDEQLKAENERLRADLRELYRCSRQCGCDKCAYRDGCALLARLRDMEAN